MKDNKYIQKIKDELKEKNDSLIICYDLAKRDFYRDNGVKEIDYGVNHNTFKVFFLFSKNDTKELYNKWCENGKILGKR